MILGTQESRSLFCKGWKPLNLQLCAIYESIKGSSRRWIGHYFSSYSSGGIQNAEKVLFFLSLEKVESGWAGGAGCNSSVVRPVRKAPATELAVWGCAGTPAGLRVLLRGDPDVSYVEPFLSAGNRWGRGAMTWSGRGGGGLS